MAIELKQNVNVEQTTAASSITVTFAGGASLPQNAIMVVTVSVESATPTVTPPVGDGWTTLTTQANNSRRTTSYWKVAGASEGTSKVFTLSSGTQKMAAVGLVIDGLATSSPVELDSIAAFSATNSPSATVNIGGSDRDGRFVIGILCVNASGTTVTSDGNGGWTNLEDNTSGLMRLRVGYGISGPMGSTSITFNPSLSASAAGQICVLSFKGDPAANFHYYSPIGGLDTYIDQNNATTNNGSATTMIIGCSGSKNSTERRGIIDFDITDIQQSAIVTSANLKLRVTVANSPSSLSIGRLRAESEVGTWVEGQATWNIYKTGFNWPGGAGAGGLRDLAESGGYGTPGVGVFLSSDISGLAQSVLQAGTDFMMFLGMNATNANITVKSSEHADYFDVPCLSVSFEVVTRPLRRGLMRLGL